MNANYTILKFSDRDALATQLVDDIVSQLEVAIKQKGGAVLALSGGSTPKKMLKVLSQASLDWSKVVVTLVDERCVPLSHDLSNAAMLQTSLLNSLPEATVFVPLYVEADSNQQLVESVLEKYCAATGSLSDSPAPFDVVILGMGEDGHTASFFPDADNVTQLVDENESEKLLTCESASTQVQRITWSLPMLLQAQMLALHIEGDSKASVLDQALSSDNKEEMPIRGAIFQQVTPLTIYHTS